MDQLVRVERSRDTPPNKVRCQPPLRSVESLDFARDKRFCTIGIDLEIGPAAMNQCFAMQLDAPGRPLHQAARDVPVPGEHELLLEVLACGVCRTDLHVVDGEVEAARPIVPGHEIVGRVLAAGSGAADFQAGDRVGVPWLGRTCGICPYCRAGHENLCDAPLFTGATRDGGFATHVVADARYCFAIPDGFTDVEAAPLLCAGLIGYRALRFAGEGERLGLYGFGAAAHIAAQVARWRGQEVHAFTRAGDTEGQAFARSLGCAWAGSSDEAPPMPLDAAIIFAPVGSLVPAALKAVRKGGRVVCAGIHMSDIPAFPYADLWGERSIASVANLTRADGIEFMEVAARVPVRTTTTAFPLSRANEALAAVRAGALHGAAVLVP
jgi:alcohol dehydrogenase, propanol-preferring